MKKSRLVSLELTSAMAVILVGCDESSQPTRREVQRCVDQNRHVVGDEYCQQQPAPPGGAPPGGVPYHWYYGGSGYYPGETASGGYETPTPGYSAMRPSEPGFEDTVVRGGFGAHGGEGAEAGE
jgi:hypothetical protein